MVLCQCLQSQVWYTTDGVYLLETFSLEGYLDCLLTV
jgi:hypothetical protein